MQALNRLLFSTVLLSFPFSASHSAEIWPCGDSDVFDPFSSLNTFSYEGRRDLENLPNSNIQSSSEERNAQILYNHLNRKPYFVSLNEKIQKCVSKIEDGDEVAGKLFEVFVDHLHDVKKLLNVTDAPSKFFSDSLEEFQKAGVIKNLVPFYQALYINYQFEALIQHHYFSRSRVTKVFNYFGLRSSKSGDALEALENVASSLNIKIDRALIGVKAINDIVNGKGDPHTIIYENMSSRKMDQSEKIIFLKGAFNHLTAQYCERTFTPLLEKSKLYDSRKRKALNDIERIATLICPNEERLTIVNLDTLQQEAFNKSLDEWVSSFENLFGYFSECKTYLVSFVWPEVLADGYYEVDDGL